MNNQRVYRIGDDENFTQGESDTLPQSVIARDGLMPPCETACKNQVLDVFFKLRKLASIPATHNVRHNRQVIRNRHTELTIDPVLMALPGDGFNAGEVHAKCRLSREPRGTL